MGRPAPPLLAKPGPRRAPLPAGSSQAGSPGPPPSRVPDPSRTTAAPELCVPARPRPALPPWRLSGRSGGSSSCSSTPRRGERLPGPRGRRREGGSRVAGGRGPARGAGAGLPAGVREPSPGVGPRHKGRGPGRAGRSAGGRGQSPGARSGSGSGPGPGPGPTLSRAQAELRWSRRPRPGSPGRGRAGPGVDSLAGVRPRARAPAFSGGVRGPAASLGPPGRRRWVRALRGEPQGCSAQAAPCGRRPPRLHRGRRGCLASLRPLLPTSSGGRLRPAQLPARLRREVGRKKALV